MALPNLKRNLDGIFETPKKATLVSPTGQRVAVPVDSPESKQYFSKGYKLETSSPVNPNAITSTGGGELPSGSVDTTQSNDQTNAYQSLLVDSLKQAQGVDTTELLQRQRDLQRKAIAARTDTAGTETMSPSQRSQIRQSNVGVIEGEIDENAYQLAKADKAIANFEDVFFKAQQFGQEFADKMAIPETMVANYKLKIEASPDQMDTMLSSLNDKSKQAVINSLDFEKMGRMSEEKEAVKKLMNSYEDAGITPEDSLLQARAKLANSRIYQKQVRIAPTGGSGDTTVKLTDDEKAFKSDLDSALDQLALTAGSGNKGSEKWGEIWDYLRNRYGTPPEILDQLLRKDTFYPR